MLGMWQCLVPFLHTPHWLVDSLASYIDLLCQESQNPLWRIVEILQQKCPKEVFIRAVRMIVFSNGRIE